MRATVRLANLALEDFDEVAFVDAVADVLQVRRYVGVPAGCRGRPSTRACIQRHASTVVHVGVVRDRTTFARSPLRTSP